MATFLKAKWENIVMANYTIPKEVLQPYLPKGVELDLYNGNAYASLVGFMFKNTRLFNIPIPLMGNFEEVNLRFYVLRKVKNQLKRGVVFINETVPYKPVAWLANKLYKEHYIAIPTKHKWDFKEELKKINYQWKVKNKWNSIDVEAQVLATPMLEDSFEKFIFEHYFGYTKVDDLITLEYKINHPSWNVHKILDYKINCNFFDNYGSDFEFLNSVIPQSVFLAEGSAVSVDWKRYKIT